MKPVIAFSRPWNNKVCCDLFTTIRPHDAQKYQVGTQLTMEVKLKTGVYDQPVKIRRVYTHKLCDIHEVIFITDMGMGKNLAIEEIKKIYPRIDCDTALFDVIVLEYDFGL